MAEKREETFKINGEDLVAKIKELLREGNVNKITIKDKDGKIIAVFPVTVGVVGLLFAPALAAIGAIAALMTECSITVERTL